MDVDVCDPWANKQEVKTLFDIDLLRCEDLKLTYDTIILAVSHNEFLNLDFEALKNDNAVIFDVKSFLPTDKIDGRL